MRRINAAHSIVIARRSGDVQPTEVLGAMGMIAALLLMWLGLML